MSDGKKPGRSPVNNAANSLPNAAIYERFNDTKPPLVEVSPPALASLSSSQDPSTNVFFFL
jgi:hypothetical protein